MRIRRLLAEACYSALDKMKYVLFIVGIWIFVGASSSALASLAVIVVDMFDSPAWVRMTAGISVFTFVCLFECLVIAEFQLMIGIGSVDPVDE